MFLCCQVNGFLPEKLSFLNLFAWHEIHNLFEFLLQTDVSDFEN